MKPKARKQNSATIKRRGGGARVIASEADIRAGVAALRDACPAMRRIHDAVGDPPLRRHRGGFEGLAQIVVAQQVSAASAAAIWRRTRALIDPFAPEVLLGFGEAELKGAGLSAPKVRTLVAMAEAVRAGSLRLGPLAKAPEDEIAAHLTAINGIGPWTANIYTLFCLGRADAWASGDLALRVATASALRLGEIPDAARIEELAERWRPWRAVAARLLWSWYAHERQQRTTSDSRRKIRAV